MIRHTRNSATIVDRMQSNLPPGFKCIIQFSRLLFVVGYLVYNYERLLLNKIKDDTIEFSSSTSYQLQFHCRLFKFYK